MDEHEVNEILELLYLLDIVDHDPAAVLIAERLVNESQITKSIMRLGGIDNEKLFNAGLNGKLEYDRKRSIVKEMVSV